MAMTKRDFEDLAAVISDSYALNAEAPLTSAERRWTLANDIAAILGASNPRFDRATFMLAATGTALSETR